MTKRKAVLFTAALVVIGLALWTSLDFRSAGSAANAVAASQSEPVGGHTESEDHDHGHETGRENALVDRLETAPAEESSDGHADHDHIAPDAPATGHEGNDHGDHGGPANAGESLESAAHETPDDVHDHAESNSHNESSSAVIHLGEGEVSQWGVETAVAGLGALDKSVQFPGEVRLNEDRIAHIVPPAKGIVREVSHTVGDNVEEGEVLAWIESAELSEAKVDYLAKMAELGCCVMDVERAEQVHDNTSRLLDLLESRPSLETLQSANGSVMGDHRSRLVSAYAEYVYARASYVREKDLYEKEIGSREDFLAAESALKKADAGFAAARDTVAFAIRRNLFEERRARDIQEIELLGAERRLHVLGVREDEIGRLSDLIASQGELPRASAEHSCEDPNCDSCRDGADSLADAKASVTGAPLEPESLGLYPLRAPFDGTVISRHTALGESVSDSTDTFTIADLSSVWVDLKVYQRDLSLVSAGMTVSIAFADGGPQAAGQIKFVSPLVNEETRTAMARVVLPNRDGRWRPGLYVNAVLMRDDGKALVVVPKDAVQVLDGEKVIFLAEADGFWPVPVVTGETDDESVEIRSGLSLGQSYVARGAFELKSQIITTGMDPHAGHGH